LPEKSIWGLQSKMIRQVIDFQTFQFEKVIHAHKNMIVLSGQKQVFEKFSFYKNLLFPLRSHSEKSHLKNGWLQCGIFSVYQMCKLLVG